MSEPRVGDVLDYGDGYRRQVAAVSTETTTKTDYKPNSWGRGQYRDYPAAETTVWVWGEEPVQAIVAGGGTVPVLPLERHLTFWWDLDRHPNREVEHRQGDTWPPEGARVLRPGLPGPIEEMDIRLEPDELKF
jgi:hypothetical protein